MSLDRRDFLKLAAGTVAASLLPSPSLAAGRPKIKAIAFDAFPIFDSRPVYSVVESFSSSKGVDLANSWRNKQFEYIWLRTLTRRYADFMSVSHDALAFAAAMLKVTLSDDAPDRLTDTYMGMKAYPDAAPALKSLKDAGFKLAFLSNLSEKMLDVGIKNSSLDGLFDHVLSTDKVQAGKPDLRAYQMGIDAFGLKVEEIAFAAFASWDAVGAKAFGYPTFWVNRPGAPPEQLGISPDGVGKDLTDLVTFVQSWQ
jgi:2-haloacid dehalogenase